MKSSRVDDWLFAKAAVKVGDSCGRAEFVVYIKIEWPNVS